MAVKLRDWAEIWDIEGIQLIGYFHNVVFSLFMSNATGIQATELKDFVEKLLQKSPQDLKFYFSFTTHMLASQDAGFKDLLCSFASKQVAGVEVKLSHSSVSPEEFNQIVGQAVERFIELDKHKVFTPL
jgi:hypothetical protein